MLIVARYLNGRVLKGSTTDFHSAHGVFHLTPPSGGRREAVHTGGMKALYCVRSLSGNPNRTDHRLFPNQEGRIRPRLWLRFLDGEAMPAWPVSPILGPAGFWVLPTDADSNLEKAYVFRRAVDEVLEGAEADRAALTIARQVVRESREGRFRILNL